jgi:hypothetical protein
VAAGSGGGVTTMTEAVADGGGSGRQAAVDTMAAEEEADGAGRRQHRAYFYARTLNSRGSGKGKLMTFVEHRALWIIRTHFVLCALQ